MADVLRYANATQFDGQTAERFSLNGAGQDHGSVYGFQKYQNGLEVSYTPEQAEVMERARAAAQEILMTKSHIMVVTGDTGSVGRKTVEAIAQQIPGAAIVGINLGRKPDQVAENMRMTTERDVNYGSIVVDLSKKKPVSDFLKDPEFPLNGAQIDRLLLTAGRLHAGEMGNFNYDELDVALQEHAIAPILMAQHLAQQWKLEAMQMPKHERPHRSIVMVSSVASEAGSPNEMPYVMAKRAAEGGILCLSRYLTGVATANVVSPGLIIDSDMGAITVANRPDVIERIPGTPVSTRDVANSLLYASSYPSMTGQTLRLNGGRTLNI